MRTTLGMDQKVPAKSLSGLVLLDSSILEGFERLNSRILAAAAYAPILCPLVEAPPSSERTGR